MINDIQGKGSSDSKSRDMVSFTLFITRSTLPLKPEITSLSLSTRITSRGLWQVLILTNPLGKNLEPEWMELLRNYKVVG